MDNIRQSADKISAWVGGIIDGEGSICVEKTTRKNGRIKLQPKITVCNTDKKIIDFYESEIKKVTGCYTYISGGTTKPCWVVVVKGFKRCKTLLPEITPLLIGRKKEKAEVMITWIEKKWEEPYNTSTDEIDLEFYKQINGI